MSLNDFMQQHGYRFRRHLEEEGWGWFKPTVVDFDVVHEDALKYGGLEGLKRFLAGRAYRPPWGLWTFPHLDIEQPLPRRSGLLLARDAQPAAKVFVPRTDAGLWEMAAAWVDMLRQRYGVLLPLCDDQATEIPAAGDAVVFGGAHRNRLAMHLALRHRTLLVDAGVPGDDGWVASVHCGLYASGANVLQVAAPAAHAPTVLDFLMENTRLSGGELVLNHVHRVVPGSAMRAHFPDWKAFTSKLPGRIRQFEGRKMAVPDDIKALSELLAQGLDSGGSEKGIYNSAPVDLTIDCARYYFLSADERALQLFRELLFRLADHYLRKPGGAEYPADLDFRLGMLVLYFARLEHLPVFTDDERLFLANLLLAAVQSIFEHSVKFWPSAKKINARHNHQTFPAVSLLYAADYFSRYNLQQVREWRRYTEEIFKCDLWRRDKQTENSRSYEPFVFEHAAAYSLFNGHGLDLFDKDCFRRMVERQIAATDNFFRAVDYGDTAINMQPVDSVSARLLATQQDGLVRWFAAQGFARNRSYMGNSFLDFPGVRLPAPDFQPPAGDWERLPVDPHFLAEVAPGLPAEAAFDKLAFRSGWEARDHYLLLEGIGGAVSHAHRDTNGIVRLNHLGRHWVVSNGYGKRIGITHAGRAFSSREQGPPDHNMLVLHREGQVVRDVLPMGALLQCGRLDRMLYATSALNGYGGVNWFRTLLVMPDAYLLVLDRVQLVAQGLQHAHVEWNCLGAVKPCAGGYRLEQDGVCMDITSASGWRMEQTVADQSACWKNILESGAYPHAGFPPAKLMFHAPELVPGATAALGTLLAAYPDKPRFSIAQPAPGCLTVRGPHAGLSGLQLADLDLEFEVDADVCTLRFADVPAVKPS